MAKKGTSPHFNFVCMPFVLKFMIFDEKSEEKGKCYILFILNCKLL